MPGSFLFTRDTAAQHGGERAVQPLLRAGNHNIGTFDAAVTDAVTNQLVTVDGTTIYMAADVAFMMIGRKSELRKQVGADNMTYAQIRSAAPNTEVFLYHLAYQHRGLSRQVDHIYVLAGLQYWNGVYGPDLTRVSIQDRSQRSWSLDLGSNPAPNATDPRMIIDKINALTN